MKVALFINTKITNILLNGKKIDKNPNNFDIFLLSLKSLSSKNYSKVYIKCDIDEEYFNRITEIKSIIETFGCEYDITYTRIYKLSDYKNIAIYFHSKYDYIVYIGNHDHIFINFKLFDIVDYLKNTISKLNFAVDSIYLSHFPEIISRTTSYFHLNVPSKIQLNCDCGTVIKWKNFDSVQLFSTQVFLKFWSCQSYNGIKKDFGWIRSDDPRFSNKINYITIVTLIPKFEILRHFDGYGHAGLKGFELDKYFADTYLNSTNRRNFEFNKKYRILSPNLNKIDYMYYRNFNSRILIFGKFKNLPNEIKYLYKFILIFLFDLYIYLRKSLYQIIN
jgi:hypothetical protein